MEQGRIQIHPGGTGSTRALQTGTTRIGTVSLNCVAISVTHFRPPILSYTTTVNLINHLCDEKIMIFMSCFQASLAL